MGKEEDQIAKYDVRAHRQGRRSREREDRSKEGGSEMELADIVDRQEEMGAELVTGDATSIPKALANGNPFTSLYTSGEEGRGVVPGDQFTARDRSEAYGWNLSSESKASSGVEDVVFPLHPPAMAKVYMVIHRFPSPPTSPVGE